MHMKAALSPQCGQIVLLLLLVSCLPTPVSTLARDSRGLGSSVVDRAHLKGTAGQAAHLVAASRNGIFSHFENVFFRLSGFRVVHHHRTSFSTIARGAFRHRGSGPANVSEAVPPEKHNNTTSPAKTQFGRIVSRTGRLWPEGHANQTGVFQREGDLWRDADGRYVKVTDTNSSRHALHLNPDDHGPGEAPKKGSDLWDSEKEWITIEAWHPAGVISTMNGGKVRWAHRASYISFDYVLALTLIAYPASWIGIVLTLTVVMGLCLVVSKDSPHESSPQPIILDGVIIPLLPVEQLSEFSRKAYHYWTIFCRCIPAVTVFGLPAVLVWYCYPRPQEVFSVVTMLTTSCMYTNALYMMLFGWAALSWISRNDANNSTVRRMNLPSQECPPCMSDSNEPELRDEDVKHWVIMPQYKESFDVVCMAIQSIAQSRLARTSISILLAMEEREAEAQEKASQIKEKFSNDFVEIFATFHPPGLPNDPPGKASNTAWAFKKLTEHLDSKGANGRRNVVLTVADADSEFHKKHFEALARCYLKEDPNEREVLLWQAPVLHVKNYHRQPAPVIIGNVTQAFIEMASMADPNAVRFPYSTYSLSMALARRVGGWDPQWIAEDWHMGIKCFLFTFGRARVLPIMLPILNYAPEEQGWLATVYARWVQMTRHALGFSDLSYYFMTLPLIFGFVMSDLPMTYGDNSPSDRVRLCAVLLIRGIYMIIKIVNVHVLLGIAVSYGLITFFLHKLMLVYMGEARLIDNFFSHADFCPFMLVCSSLVCTVVMSIAWLYCYGMIKERIEPESEGRSSMCFRFRILHWLYIVLSIQIFGGLFFAALTLATWQAALKVMLYQTFEYKVAAKPTKESRLK